MHSKILILVELNRSVLRQTYINGDKIFKAKNMKVFLVLFGKKLETANIKKNMKVK